MKKVLVMSVVLATLVWTMGLATFIPAVSAATLTAGDLIKGSGSAVYFYAADGKRYTFPTLSTYMTWYSDFTTVKTITDSEMAAISLAGNVVVRPGTKLIKIDTVPKVFAVEPKGKLVWVASEAVANTLYGADWAKKIVTIPDGFWTNYTDSGLSLSGTTYPEGQLVKWVGSTNVYYVTGGKKALVSSDAVLAANMWKAGDVVTAPASITMADGTAITAAVSTLVDVSQGGGAGAALPTGTGTLTVALAGDTPAASPVADGATANFVKFGLTANGAAMTVSKVVLTKGGYSGTGDVENVKITDLSGVALTNSTSLNTNGTAALTFSPALSLAAGETRYFLVRSGIVNGTTSGVTASFAIAASTDVTSSAASVAGNFPVLGNAMSVVAVTIGTATVYTDGTVTDTTPDGGDVNVVLNKFRVEAGTTEAITIESMTFMEAGTAGLSDVKNVELWSVTQSKSLGEVAAYDSNGNVSFTNLNIVVGKGEIHRFTLREDIISGAGLTTNADLIDGATDVLMSVKGNAYGFYITPAVGGGWNGKGAADQTINAGSLSITKSTTTPATGKIAEASDQLLAVFDVDAKGEEVKVSAFKVNFTLGGTADGADLISCKLLDKNGLLVAGPVDGTDALDYVNFTDTFIVPVGVNKYSLKCRVFDSDSNDFAGGATWQMVVTGATGITAKGYTTNDSITPSGVATANVMTVATATLAATTLGTPAAQSVSPGLANFVWSTFTLDAANSGENINVTSVVLEDTTAAAGVASDIDNVEVWCDATSASSDRGDIYEKLMTDTEEFVGAAGVEVQLTMNFIETLTVVKNSFVKCAVVADLGSGAAAGEKHSISLDEAAAAVSGTGADTGTTANATPTGAGQQMTVAANGALTVSVDSTSPKAALFVSNEAKQTLAVFKLAADSVEALDLDEFKITDDGFDIGVANYYFYSSKRADGVAVTEPIATKTGGATATAIITDGAVTIPASGYVLLTVKGDINFIDGTTIDNADTIEVTVAVGTTDVLTTGLSSGASVVGGATNYDAATHQIYEARPVVTKDSSSPSGTLATGSSSLVAVFKIDNTSGTQDIVMDDADSASMIFNLSGFSSGATCAACTVTFKDKNGNTLGSDTSVDLTGAIAVTDATLAFDGDPLTVPAGDYELIKVYANTTDFTTAGNSLQVWLDDAVAANFTWSIDSAAGGNGGANLDAYTTADVSWRGDVYGNTLGK